MADLTSLDAVKAWIGINGFADDAVLQSLVTAYSQYAQQWMNRNILSQSYVYTCSGRGQVAQMVPQWPITAVASVIVDGVSIPARSGPGASGYFFDENSIILEGYSFTRGRSNVSISYTAGYSVVPPELAQAINEWVALRYANRDKQGWSSKTLGSETVSLIVRDMPDSVKTILGNWKAVVPL